MITFIFTYSTGSLNSITLYPNLYYLFRETLGIEWPFLNQVTTFGFSIALAFLFGIYFLKRDLLIKETKSYYNAGLKKSPKVLPSKTLGTVALISTISGIMLGKVFFLFENSNELNNIKSVFSLAGINYFGALIGMLITCTIYYYQNNINPLYFFDSAAPSFMLSYSIGRLGCHVSGDGDWGIINTTQKPARWISDWLWAYNYPHNLKREGIIMSNCNWDNYCYKLPQAVFPTPLYEAMVCFLFFLLLWWLKKQFHTVGLVMGIYLILSGMERLLIEEIRINPLMKWVALTQAQLISLIAIVGGCTLLIIIHNKKKSNKEHFVSSST